MVGGFVQDEHIGPGQHQLQQSEPRPLAAGQRADLFEHIVVFKEKSAQQTPQLSVAVQRIGVAHFL